MQARPSPILAAPIPKSFGFSCSPISFFRPLLVDLGFRKTLNLLRHSLSLCLSLFGRKLFHKNHINATIWKSLTRKRWHLGEEFGNLSWSTWLFNGRDTILKTLLPHKREKHVFHKTHLGFFKTVTQPLVFAGAWGFLVLQLRLFSWP